MNKEQKVAGLLMPLASLSGGQGIGDMGSEAYRFIDQLSNAGLTYWQVLPLNIFDLHGCPYASPSAFGGEGLLLSLEKLGVPASKLAYPNEARVDYQKLREHKRPILKDFIQQELKKSDSHSLMEVFKTQHFWAHDLCVFLALREKFGIDWTGWPRELLEIEHARAFVNENLLTDYQVELYKQFAFERQWNELKAYAKAKNVALIGDIPIFVSALSFDSWRWGHLFKRDQKSGRPHVITGAPPDAFSVDGQLWGTLNYEWQTQTTELLWWWKERLAYSISQFDLVRLDHFIGFHHVWETPVGEKSAAFGKWTPSEGQKLFEMVKQEFPHMPFIAEDLGALTQEVTDLRETFGLPSMKVFQFSIDDNPTNENLPLEVSGHTFYYAGTHDNNTLKGWLDENFEHPDFRQNLAVRLELEGDLSLAEIIHEIQKVILNSKAQTVIFQLQDIFELGSEARINVPGTMNDNWSWRIESTQWDQSKWNQFAKIVKESGRVCA